MKSKILFPKNAFGDQIDTCVREASRVSGRQVRRGAVAYSMTCRIFDALDNACIDTQRMLASGRVSDVRLARRLTATLDQAYSLSQKIRQDLFCYEKRDIEGHLLRRKAGKPEAPIAGDSPVDHRRKSA